MTWQAGRGRLREIRAQCREGVRHLRLRRCVGAYVDGELPPARRAELTAHLVRCWTCSGHAETLRLIKHSLGNGPVRAPSALTEARLRRYAVRLGADSTDR
ncbi:anti-sigma factor family protein [Actinacidiphila acididurans]|uniref:Zf-HC2 domain-containing protein n=1 Tax=Actinacidiphila acididurans TaxID=2784346 RepID=A0ABS2TUR8_9ACTN|nr:zf-HC2 domain-containing protein [Actinacidiphila acididurans]MBM9506246.1 zf-HC2 domain-containing protein [Actinacidiphila acididurans]